MGILSFFRKKSEKKAIGNDTHYNNGEIDKLFIDKKYDEIITLFLARFVNQEMPIDIKQKVALAYYYKQDYENSLTLFEEIALKKNNTESNFNVLMSLLPLNKIPQAKELFGKMIRTNKRLTEKQPRELAVPFIRYYYACGLCDAGLFDEALEQANELKKIYMDLKITDDTFVYLRGVPFLSQTLDLAKKIFKGLGGNFSDSDFIKELKSKVDDDGKALIKEFLSGGKE
jgi:tetratricopeptide (TPR) repeat protein